MSKILIKNRYDFEIYVKYLESMKEYSQKDCNPLTFTTLFGYNIYTKK